MSLDVGVGTICRREGNKVDIQSEGRSSKCARCHRALKDPVSIERGIGPVCWAKLGKHLEHQEQIEESLQIPFAEGY